RQAHWAFEEKSHDENSAVRALWHGKLFQHLLLFTLIVTFNSNVLADESGHPSNAEIKAITLIEKSNTVVHAEFSIQMKPNQLSYRIDELSTGIIPDSIKIIPVDKTAPQIIEQTLTKKSFDPNHGQRYPILKLGMADKIANDSAVVALTKSLQSPGLHLKSPSLYLKFSESRKEKQKFLLTYQVTNVTWQSNIDMQINHNRVDISSWVSIDNSSNLDFENVKVMLIENTAPPTKQNSQDFSAIGRFISNRAYQNQPMPAWVKVYAHKISETVSIPSFSQTKALLYQYTDIPIKFQLVYEGMIRDKQYFSQNDRYQRSNSAFNQRSQKKVWQVMQVLLQNKKNILHPLPASKLRIYDANNILISTQYLGRVRQGEQLELDVNPENELLARRTQLTFDVIERDRVIEETYKIDLKNSTNQAYEILVREYLDRSSVVSIVDATHKYSIKNNILNYLVEIKAGSAISITYTARYTW
ncbi:MAG: DUF4139 domain-containing protein, partial [Gammaproteobacteria bacterium]|nr:DUF4139 domain-containing protein [Gammaproteobacteria bacterium]